MKVVYLTTLVNNVQAAILKDILHNEGIECLIKNETLSPFMDFSPGHQIELHVLEKDYDRAMKIAKEGFPELVGE